MLQRILIWSFYTLFFLTPLVFTKYNHELFEYNKMILVYILTTIITGTWVLKILSAKKLVLKRTPLDIPILLFLISQILSTILSIDSHTSIWGYYSRSNGGLLSLISYVLLYYALVSNFDFKQALKFLQAAIFGGLAISLYAIPEHFGFSPSCLILVQELSASCWVQDVQARVFATLGQPNWLAAYLGMLIFPTIYLALTTRDNLWKAFYALTAIAMYMAFTFTYSRGATLGVGIAFMYFILFTLSSCLVVSKKVLKIQAFLLVGTILLASILGLIGLITETNTLNQNYLISFLLLGVSILILVILEITVFLFIFTIIQAIQRRSELITLLKSKITLMLVAFFAIFLMVNLLFGSALNDFRLIKKSAPPARPGLVTQAPSGTQLENGGTESGQIRLIVWKGALEIFKHYPIFGSGVETFAYSYYAFRPQEHNLVSEWDFLYNKAHNEYLNYLATTGAVGFISYMLLILTFIGWSTQKIFNFKFTILNQFSNYNFKIWDNLNKNFKFQISNLEPSQKLLLVAILASYISYLIQNIFGFSVVIIAVFFFLFPALAFLATGELENMTFNKLKRVLPIFYLIKTHKWFIQQPTVTQIVIEGVLLILFIYFQLNYGIFGWIPFPLVIFLLLLLLPFAHKSRYLLKILTILVMIYFLSNIRHLWLADYYYKSGLDYGDSNDISKSYNDLLKATEYNGNEPLYNSELGFAAATASIAFASEDATVSGRLAKEAEQETALALSKSPNNVSLWRTAIRTYYVLTDIDPKFEQKTIDTIDQTIRLAPTDAKLYYNKGLILFQLKKTPEAIEEMKKTIALKPNYREAYFTLGVLYNGQKQREQAIEAMNQVLQLVPNDPDALEKIKEWTKK